MKSSRFPLLYRFLAILSDVVLDLLLLHERGKNGLINGVVCNTGEKGTWEGGNNRAVYIPSTMRTLIGGTIFGSWEPFRGGDLESPPADLLELLLRRLFVTELRVPGDTGGVELFCSVPSCASTFFAIWVPCE